MVAHCVGSLINHAALLSGRTTGKIRNLISMQLAANPISGTYAVVRAGIYIPGVLETLGFTGMDPTESPEKLTDHLFNAFVKDVSNVFFSYKERCQYHVCHR